MVDEDDNTMDASFDIRYIPLYYCIYLSYLYNADGSEGEIGFKLLSNMILSVTRQIIWDCSHQVVIEWGRCRWNGIDEDRSTDQTTTLEYAPLRLPRIR